LASALPFRVMIVALASEPILSIVGAVGALVSRVKLSAGELADTFPARSVCRTVTDLAPSPVRVKLDPVRLHCCFDWKID
jgi:hypothetical protein